MIATFVCYVSVGSLMFVVCLFRRDLRARGVVEDNKVSSSCRIVVVICQFRQCYTERLLRNTKFESALKAQAMR